MEIDAIEDLLNEFKHSFQNKSVNPTIFEISGYPHFENVCSNILAFFFDPNNPHGLGDLFLNSLLETVDIKDRQSSIEVVREQPTKEGRIDLLISSDTHMIAIENKVNAQLNNPLGDYLDHIIKNKSERVEGNCFGILLTLRESTEPIPERNFHRVTYSKFFNSILSNIGEYMLKADSKHINYLLELINTMNNQLGGNVMDEEYTQLVSTLNNRKDDLQNLFADLKSLRAHLRGKIDTLASNIMLSDYPDIKSAKYRENIGGWIGDCLYYELQLPEGVNIFIDAAVETNGWNINVRLQNNKEDRGNLEKSLRNRGIGFVDGRDNLKERFYYDKDPDPNHTYDDVFFPFSEPVDNIANHLQSLLISLLGNMPLKL